MPETVSAAVAPMLVDARQAAAICNVSIRTWWTLHASGRCPLPVRLGRRTLWRSAELAAWIEARCPPRDRWQTMKGAGR